MKGSRQRRKASPEKKREFEETSRPLGLRFRGAALLAFACFAVYLTSLRAGLSWDTVPSRLLPFSILREGNLDLDEFHWLFRLSPPPYFIRQTEGGHWMSVYPVATSILGTPVALPAVLWLRKNGISDDDVRFRLAIVVTERLTAALISAASAGILFLTLARLTRPGVTLLLTIVYAFGTNTWVTSSQAMWQHGLAEFSLAGLSFFLLGPDTRRNAVGASACAALGTMARPTMMIFALLALWCMWRSRRSNIVSFLALPVLGAAALLSYNLGLVGGIAGAYGGKFFALPSLTRLAGLLVSPNRGLFVYTPFALLALSGIRRSRADRRGWLHHLSIGIGGYLFLYSCYEGWYGGSVYGPRMLVDLMPAVILLAVPATQRLLSTRPGSTACAALMLWGVVVQGIGVYFDDNRWNTSPHTVDIQRIWDWNDLQIVRAVRAGWHGTDLAPLLWQAFSGDRAAVLQPLAVPDLAAELTTSDEAPLQFRRGHRERLRLIVRNRGQVIWPGFSDFGYLECAVGYRWWKDGALLAESGSLRLPRNLAPGDSVEVAGWAETPEETGRAELELALVQVLDVKVGRSGGDLVRVPVEIR